MKVVRQQEKSYNKVIFSSRNRRLTVQRDERVCVKHEPKNKKINGCFTATYSSFFQSPATPIKQKLVMSKTSILCDLAFICLIGYRTNKMLIVISLEDTEINWNGLENKFLLCFCLTNFHPLSLQDTQYLEYLNIIKLEIIIVL